MPVATTKKKMFIYYSCVDEKEIEVTSIRMYGLGENNENICIRITNFTPYVYIELPSDVSWNEGNVKSICNKINKIMGNTKPLKQALVYRHKLYGAHLTEDNKRRLFPYLFCSFSSKNDISFLTMRLKKDIGTIVGIGSQIKLKIHEQDASPILQMICAKNINSVGWINFSGTPVNSEDKMTVCDEEYYVKWNDISKFETDHIGNPLVMGFDIEVNSSNPAAMPDAKKANDKIFQISCVFTRDNDGDDVAEKYLLTLGETDENLLEEATKLLMFRTEAELLIGFTKLILLKNPNVIVGYNILGFDIPYMIKRQETCGLGREFTTMGFSRAPAIQRKIKWSSSAYGTQEFEYLDAEGRIFVDLLPLIKRDYKLDNYKLKTVSEYFLKDDTKADLSVSGIFKCYRVGTKKEADGTYSKMAKKAIALCGKYCVQDSVLVVKLMKKIQTWVGLCEMAKTVNCSIFSLYTQGQQIKVFSQVYKYAKDNNIVVEKDGYQTKEDERYVGAHVFPPVPGIYDRVLPFDFCLAGDTLVTMSNGLSKRLDSLCQDESVLGYKIGSGFANFSSINGLQRKGLRETVKVFFEDGSSVVATPDHKFLLDNNEWCEAKDLLGKAVKSGLEGPEDKVNNHWEKEWEKEWSISVEGYEFSMKTFVEREKSLAFARINGYLFGRKLQGCSGTFFKTLIDAKNFKQDIQMLLSIDVMMSKGKFGYTVNIPSRMPRFKSDEDIFTSLTWGCPYSFKREFYGGFFGSIYLRPGYSSLDVKTLSYYTVYNLLTHLKYLFEILTDDNGEDISIENFSQLAKTTGCRYDINTAIKLSAIKNQDDNEDILQEIWERLEDTVKLEDVFITPSLKKTVIDVRPNGLTEVFDIEVQEVHNFLANGVVVHNCSLYPTTIIAYNIDYSTLVTDDSIPDSKCHVMQWEDHLGCEHDPKVIRRMELSAIIEKEKQEIKALREKRDSKEKSTKKKDLTFMIEMKRKKQEWIDLINEKTEKLKPLIAERSALVKTIQKNKMCAARNYRFVKEPLGVLPTILQNLLDARKKTRNQIKNYSKTITEENKNEVNMIISVLDKRQLAYKISANSMYGAMGVKKGYLPFMPGAMCTTYKGRCNIEIVAKTIPEKYGGQLVYGDTDSNYIHFPHLKTAQDSWDFAELVASEVSELFPKPIKLDFEAVIYWRFFILTKKRYMYKSCLRDGDVGEKIGKKGVLLARRDSSVFVRNLYEDVIKMVFKHTSKEDILYFILQELNRMFSNSVDYKKFVITKSVGSTENLVPTYVKDEITKKDCLMMGDYKVPPLPLDEKERKEQIEKKDAVSEQDYYEKCLPAQVQLALKMRQRGHPIQSGTRLEYIITDIHNHTDKQYEKIEDYDYFKKFSHVLTVDFFYYLKVAINSIDEVLNIAFGAKLDFMKEQYVYRYKVRQKVLSDIKQITATKLVFIK